MKIVIDTNVYIQFIFKGNPRIVFDRVLKRIDDLYVSNEILDELCCALTNKKFNLDINKIIDFLEMIKNVSNIVIPDINIENVCRDNDDNKILSCAVSANADFIITGDKDLLVLKEFNNIKILTSKEYLDFVEINT